LPPHLLIRVRSVHCHCIVRFYLDTPTNVSSELGSASFPIAPLRPTSPDLLISNGISLRSTASALLATLAPSRTAGGLATRASHGETISSSTYATFIISTYQSDGQANEAHTGQVASHCKSPSLFLPPDSSAAARILRRLARTTPPSHQTHERGTAAARRWIAALPENSRNRGFYLFYYLSFP
jgi:hypothetical protein